MRKRLLIVTLGLLLGSLAQADPRREVWRGTCETDLRAGKGQSFRLVTVEGGPLNTPVDIDAGTRAVFSGVVRRDQASATITFTKPIRNYNGMALLRAVPAGGNQAGGLIDGALAWLPGWARSLMKSRLQSDQAGVLDSTPVYLKEMKLEIGRGARTLEQECRCEARICKIFRVPLTTRLSIPLRQLSPCAAADARGAMQGDLSAVEGFLRAAQGEGLIDPQPIPR